jgi:hypothetical protein
VAIAADATQLFEMGALRVAVDLWQHPAPTTPFLANARDTQLPISSHCARSSTCSALARSSQQSNMDLKPPRRASIAQLAWVCRP